MKFSEALAQYSGGVPAGVVKYGRPPKDWTLSALEAADVVALGVEMDTLLVNLNPILQNLYVKNASFILNAIRMVNTETKQGFKGSLAGGGPELDIQFLTPRIFKDPDAAANTLRTTWNRTITAAMVTARDCPFIHGLLSAAFAPPAALVEVALPMTAFETVVILGLVNDAALPCCNGLQITANTIPYDIQDMDFELVDPFLGTTLWELKQPWTIPPLQTGLMHVRYYRAGNDELKPIGVWVRQSNTMRAL